MNAATDKTVILRWASAGAAIVVLVVSGWVHGTWTGRWGQSNDLAEAVVRVPHVPTNIGEWESTELPTEDEAFAQAGADSYWMRRYTHSRTKMNYLVILMCGRAGRMAVHTPEVCYRGAGYELVENPSTWTTTWPGEQGEEHANLWTAKFRKERSLASGLRLYWGWNAHGEWQAPVNPRLQFEGQSFLYKLYISHEQTGSDPTAAKEFLETFLPATKKTLFPLRLQNS